MGADRHSGSGQLSQPGSIKYEESGGEGRVLDVLVAPVSRLWAGIAGEIGPEAVQPSAHP